MKRSIAAILMMFVAVAAAMAQKAVVERVELAPMDLSASKYPRTDLNGKACALVKVEVLADDVEFFGDVVKPVEHKTGEYWVYMPGGSKMLQIKSGSFLPVFINFADYRIDALQPNCTYAVTLSLPAAAAPKPASAGMNYLVMTVTPANAKVTVDDKEREVRNGSVKVLLRNGTYTYHVEAPGYLPEDGQVTVSNARAERAVTLRSNKGTLAVTSATPATEIYVNGERMGAGSWRGELLPDTYLVEGRLASHRNAEQVVTVTTGQTATVNLPALTPVTGSLNVDYEPVGASITIDGTDRGTTPAVIDNLPVGPHSVTIAAPGHTPQTLSATITESQMATLSGSLSQAPADANYVLFRDDNDKYGFKDENGKIVIPAKYDWTDHFSEGLALVKINDKYGFINRNDKLVIPVKYDIAWSFSEGLALVEIKGKYGFIDKTDKLVIPAKYDLARAFSEGLVAVKINDKWGFINKNGKLEIPAKYDFARYFSEGLAAVEINGKWGFIDKTDKLVIPAKYESAYPFSEGLALVEIKGKWGFIDKTDKLVIPAKYDVNWYELRDSFFENGNAKVKLDGRWFYIDKNGNEVK